MGHSWLTFQDKSIVLNDNQIIILFWHLRRLAEHGASVLPATVQFLDYAVVQAQDGGVGTIWIDLDSHLTSTTVRKNVIDLLQSLKTQLMDFGARTPAAWVEQTDPDVRVGGDSDTRLWLSAVEIITRLLEGRISSDVHRYVPYFTMHELNCTLPEEVNSLIPGFTESPTAARDLEELLDRYTLSDILAYLSDPQTQDFPPDDVGAFFDTLEWSLDEPDAARLNEVTEYWLNGEAEREIAYVLARKSIFPFDSKAK